MRINSPLVRSEPRILGIDIENGPRWGFTNGYVYIIVHCLSIKWLGSPDDEVRTFWIDWRQPDEVIRAQLAPLWKEMEAADGFLGHNFAHDFGGLRGLARDVGVPFPQKKRVIDTFKDVERHTGASKSLEDMVLQFELGEKPHIPQRVWVDAFTRAKEYAIKAIINRNQVDVILTERLYLKEKDLGWL